MIDGSGDDVDVRRAAPRLLVFIVAYQAETTIEAVLRRIPASLAQTFEVEILIVDDSSNDTTFRIGFDLSRGESWPFRIEVLYNPVNQGYGGNQKIGYHYAVKNGFDFVVLLHGDGQYAPERIPCLLKPLLRQEADMVFGSRMMNPREALKGGMPLYKFVGNRILTSIQNTLLGSRLTEFHSGYRAYTVNALRQIPFERNTNDFHFDTEIIIQLFIARMRIAEVPIPTYYGDEICRVNGVPYAARVILASVQAWFQRVHLFYDRRYDCSPPEQDRRYPSKLDFDSTHSRVLDLVAPGTRVLDLGSGIGAVGSALKERKGCTVVGVDAVRGALVNVFDGFIEADLDRGIPIEAHGEYDYILALDVVEHLASPDDFLDELRELAATCRATVIVTTANIGFILMRLSLLLGRFEYGRRGILDLTHTRLFTFATLRRALNSAGFLVRSTEGVVVPMPLVFGSSSAVGRAMLGVNQLLVRLWPALFGFQLLFVAAPRPTLASLLRDAEGAARVKSSGGEAGGE